MLSRRLLPAALVTCLALALPAASEAATATNSIAGAPSLTGAGLHTVTYDTDNATLENGEPTHFNADYGNSVWIKWTPTQTMNMRLDNHTGGSPGTKVRIYKKGSGPTTSVTNLDTVPWGADGTPWMTYEGAVQVLAAQAGQTYFIVVVRSKYMNTSDPGGTLTIQQSSAKPSVTFPGAPVQTGGVAKIPFSAPGAISFGCKIDGAPVWCYSNGDSGFFQQGFADHKTHVLTVHATNGFYNQGNDYVWTFNADGLAPDTVIDSPAPTTLGAYAVEFHASETEGVTFKCQLVSETQPVPCTSPWTIQQTLYTGGHTVRVVAYDKWGNGDATPADQKLYVTEAPKPKTPTPVSQQQPLQQQPVQQQPVQQTTPTQVVPPVVVPPAGPCAVRVTHGRLTRRGMKVRIAGDAKRSCIATVELRAGRRVLARQVRPVAAGGTLAITLRPRVTTSKRTRVRLVSSAR